VIMSYPSYEDTIEVIKRYSGPYRAEVRKVVSRGELLRMQEYVYRVYIDDSVAKYIADIVEASRKMPEVRLGVSPRGAIALALAAKAHRIYLSPTAAFEGITTVDVVKKLLETVEVPV